MPLTLVAHKTNKKREKKGAFKYSAVINILCDINSDVVHRESKKQDT